MRIIIELDEQGQVTVERESGPEPVGGATRVSARSATTLGAVDAGPPPAWLLRARGAPAVAPRRAPGQAADSDGGAARA